MNLPSFISNPGRDLNRILFAPLSWRHLSTAKASKTAKHDAILKPSHTKDAILKLSHTTDAILKPSRSNDATHKVTQLCLHSRHEYGIVRSPIHRNTSRGVCGSVISI
ncbi:hypothetical protein TNCV_2651041 [Trichonephila clavipes]|nr:hypothetical protein TNCV_2651041 [Trichonephila clavipes]